MFIAGTENDRLTSSSNGVVSVVWLSLSGVLNGNSKGVGMIHFHRWTKWYIVTRPIMLTGILVPEQLKGKQLEKDYQRRECQRCGKIQEAEL
jgi:hypothetical protein